MKLAKLFVVPVVHSTVNVASGRGGPTIPQLAELLEDNPPIDRTTPNAWEDVGFLNAVPANRPAQTDRMCLWTEICMAFPALDALAVGHLWYRLTVSAASSRSSRLAGDGGRSSSREAGRHDMRLRTERPGQIRNEVLSESTPKPLTSLPGTGRCGLHLVPIVEETASGFLPAFRSGVLTVCVVAKIVVRLRANNEMRSDRCRGSRPEARCLQLMGPTVAISADFASSALNQSCSRG